MESNVRREPDDVLIELGEVEDAYSDWWDLSIRSPQEFFRNLPFVVFRGRHAIPEGVSRVLL